MSEARKKRRKAGWLGYVNLIGRLFDSEAGFIFCA